MVADVGEPGQEHILGPGKDEQAQAENLLNAWKQQATEAPSSAVSVLPTGHGIVAEQSRFGRPLGV